MAGSVKSAGALVDGCEARRRAGDSKVSRWMRSDAAAGAVFVAQSASAMAVAASRMLTPSTDIVRVSNVAKTSVPRQQVSPVARVHSSQRSQPGSAGQDRCEWCRQSLGPRSQSGRKRVYCSQSCRQRAYQSRKRSKQLGLRDGEVVVSSVLLARMNKRLAALEVALADVEAAEIHLTDERVYQLWQAGRRLRRLVVGPPTR